VCSSNYLPVRLAKGSFRKRTADFPLPHLRTTHVPTTAGVIGCHWIVQVIHSHTAITQTNTVNAQSAHTVGVASCLLPSCIRTVSYKLQSSSPRPPTIPASSQRPSPSRSTHLSCRAVTEGSFIGAIPRTLSFVIP
jgi:hypothetical protein